MWILKDIEQHKKKSMYPKIIIWLLILAFAWYFSYAYFFWNKEEVQEKELKSFTVKTWDLKTSIFWDWKVLYKEDYNLNFPITWTIKEINFKEWDFVKAWDVIATLDDSYLKFDVDSAEISLKKARADLDAKKNQYSSSDIKLSQEQLDSVKVNLESVKLAWETDVANYKKALEAAELNYNSILESIDDVWTLWQTEISNAKLALESAQKDLDSAKDNLVLIEKQETEKYENKLEDIITTIWTDISFSKEVLLDIDVLLWVTSENKDQNNSIENYLWAKDKESKQNAIKAFNEANNAFNTFLEEWKKYRSSDSDLYEAESYLDSAESNTRLINQALWYTLETIKASIASMPDLTQEKIDSYINDYENKIDSIKNEIRNLVDARQNAVEQKTALDTKVETQKNTISSLELKLSLAESNLQKTISNSDVSDTGVKDKLALAEKDLEKAKINYENAQKKAENNLALAEKQINISEASLSLKTDSPSYSELAPYYTNIENAEKQLEEAQKKLEDAVLKSPIDWKVVEINWNIWSFVWWDKDTSFVTITNNNKFYVESYIEELDISRIAENSKVYLTFDALDWVKLEWEIYYISDKSTTDNNWIVTYKVEISFDPKWSAVREWMTTYVEYITNEVKNAKIIPVWAVKPVNWKPSVELEDWTWKEVVTWFTDSKMVEIISGLEKGDQIVY